MSEYTTKPGFYGFPRIGVRVRIKSDIRKNEIGVIEKLITTVIGPKAEVYFEHSGQSGLYSKGDLEKL
jgi:hypothetical protein